MHAEENPVPDFRPFTSLTGQIADHLTEQIVSGRLAPDQRIQEQQVARSLGVSRGSVREALLILQRRHLIDIVPRRGAVVSSLSRRQLDDLFDVNEVLYGMIGRQMARMWDEEDAEAFEEAYAEIARAARAGNVQAYSDACDAFLKLALDLVRNQYLDAVIDSMMPLSRRALHRLVELDPNLLEAGVVGWRAFLDAMASGDPDRVTGAVSKCFSRHRATLVNGVPH